MEPTKRPAASGRDRVEILLRICAALTLLLILSQFLMAGLSLFHNGAIWNCHRVAGFLIGLPVALMVLIAALQRRWRLFWCTAALAISLVIQILLIAIVKQGGPLILQALHPFNGALMLTIAMVVLSLTGMKQPAAPIAGLT